MDSGMTKLITTMFRFIPALILVFAAAASTAPSFVIWPMPPKAPGLSDAEYPVPREYACFRNFQDQINKARSICSSTATPSRPIGAIGPKPSEP